MVKVSLSEACSLQTNGLKKNHNINTNKQSIKRFFIKFSLILAIVLIRLSSFFLSFGEAKVKINHDQIKGKFTGFRLLIESDRSVPVSRNGARPHFL